MPHNELLTETVRPQNLNQVILLDRIRQTIGDGTNIQNMIFAGTPGTGKTSLSKVLAKNRDSIYINASEERGIDTVRETIIDFCSTVSMNGQQKLVILDEIDGAADLFFKSLRATIEKFPEVRFIATCNYVNKIPTTMFSRLLMVEFDPKNKEEEEELKELYAKRIKLICLKRDIEWESDELLREFVHTHFPDLRKIFNKIQDFANSKIKLIENKHLNELNYSYNSLFTEILNKNKTPKDNYVLIMGEYATKTEEVFEAFGREFIPWLEDNYPDKYLSAYPGICILVADYQAKRRLTIQPAVALLALIYEIQKLLK